MKMIKDKEILVAADFAGVQLKDAICDHLKKKGWHIITVWECELKKKNRELRLERLLSEITLEDFDNGTNQS